MTSLARSPRIGFLAGDRRAARVARPLTRFLAVEAAGGMLLALATLAALVWVNVASASSYHSVWSSEVRVEIGSYVFTETLGHLVNDLLMALFFFVAGMEIKREIVHGDLRNPRVAALPALAALGGMLVPAAIYLAFNTRSGTVDGWGIPMATDIAFALGVVALLGDRVPAPAKLMLLTLAIVDDIGAIAVIAVFYTGSISLPWLIVAAFAAVVLAVLHRADVTYAPVLTFAAVALWLTVYESGVHATIAGVIAGLLMPARPRLTEDDAERIVDTLENRAELDASEIRATAAAVRASVSDCDRAIAALHPWTSFVIVPLFALANAGIELDVDSFTSPSRVFAGVAVGLVAGKLIGIASFSWLAIRLGVARMPTGMGGRHIAGVGAVAGIGFTVSLFVTTLALDARQAADAKAAILAASVIATAAGLTILGWRLSAASADRGPAEQQP